MKNSLIIPSIILQSSDSVPSIEWYSNNEGTTLDVGKNLETAKLVEIYKNGLLLENSVDYTISGSEITFTESLTTSTKIAVKIYGETEVETTEIEVVSDSDGNLVLSKSDMQVSDNQGNITLTNIQVNSDSNGNVVLE